ncbi:MAG: phosphatidic acid phosphatase [Chloroflexi bacterium]|nr:phosphatidic acid phosphatase [Chloroflexota bacterium]
MRRQIADLDSERQAETRNRLADLISNILSPFSMSLVLILLLSFTAASSRLDALKWTLISSLMSILPVLLVILYMVRNGKLDAVFINTREQRTRIYLLAGLCAIISDVILHYLEAPPVLVAAFTTGLATVAIFTVINLWWKVSIHTAFVASTVTLLVMLYGGKAAVTVVFVPLMAWARVELKHHTLAQAATGALLAAVIVVLVFVVFYPSLLLKTP